jgi:Family of unknown function (DUF5681)
MSNNTTDKPYEVGFSKPPQSTRFRKGQTGNPKGRPRGKPNLATVINRTLQAKVIINENGRRREVTKYEAGLIQLSNKAASGDLAALKMVIMLAQLAEEALQQQEIPGKTAFGESDQRVLQGLIQRLGATDEEEEQQNVRKTE